jgi:pimeloyl-ACP methyl ester carboxylesterase
VADLAALLDVAGVDGPYVLVGSTVGTLYVQHFARLYPDSVAGIVLLGPYRAERWEGDDPFLALVPEAERESVRQRQLAGATGENPDRLDFLTSYEQIASLPPPPERPAVVVVPGLPEPFPPNWPADEMMAVFLAAHESIATSLGARVVVAPNAHSFDMPTAEPAIVVQTIRDVVQAARDPASWATPAA